jgi:hypothetical protein
LTLAASAGAGSAVNAAKKLTSQSRGFHRRVPVGRFVLGPLEPGSRTVDDMSMADASRVAPSTEGARFRGRLAGLPRAKPHRKTGRRKLRRPVRRLPTQKQLVQSEARTPSLARWKAPRSFRLPGEIRRAQLFTTCLPSGFNALYGIRCLRTPALHAGNHLEWYFG